MGESCIKRWGLFNRGLNQHRLSVGDSSPISRKATRATEPPFKFKIDHDVRGTTPSTDSLYYSEMEYQARHGRKAQDLRLWTILRSRLFLFLPRR